MGGLNYITTILTMRTKGLSMMRLPLTQWSLLITAILGLLAFPVLLARRDSTDVRSHRRNELLRSCRNHHESECRSIIPAAIRCSGSTCSGSSATPRCTS